MPLRLPLVTAILSAALLVGAPVAGAEKWAGPSGAGTTCSWVTPCSLSTAIGSAVTGERVTVLSGVYNVSSGLSTTTRIDIVGDTVGPRPVLVGANNLGVAVLGFKNGGTLRHIEIEARSAGGDALSLQNGTAEDVVLEAVGGDAAKVVGGIPGTVLRDALLYTAVGGSYAAAKLRDGPVGSSIDLRNVTAMAPAADATAIRCETNVSATTLKNVLARGGTTDIDASTSGSTCAAAFSNFRLAASPGMAAGDGHQQTAPVFADADYRPAATSPTVDAGTADALLGATDPDGVARTVGPKPDIGAWEYPVAPPAPPAPAPTPQEGADDASAPSDDTSTVRDGAPAGGDQVATDTTPPADDTGTDTTPGLPPATAPEVGESVSVVPASGAVRVRLPNGKGFVPLAAGVPVPVGATVDTTAGTVRLVSAVDAKGRTQTGTFSGGVFVVRQKRAKRPMTELVLRGGDFSSCKKRTQRGVARAARAPRSLRRLWGKDDHGRFRTRGKHAVATVRGTEWLTEDSCKGTRVSVKQGAVDVAPVKGDGEATRVRAGRSLLVRPR